MITKFDIGQYVYYDCYGSSLHDLIVKEGTVIGIEIDRDGITYCIDWSLKDEPSYVQKSSSMGVPEEYLFLDKQEILKKYS